MAQIDKDGDGKVSKDEAPAMMKGNFDKIDSNGDGFLDGDEMRSFFQKRGAQGRPAT